MIDKHADLPASEPARLLSDIKLLQEVSAAISEQVDDDALYDQLIEGAARIMRSDFASMQMLNPEREQRGELRLLACRGFNSRAKIFWAQVSCDGESSCALALLTGKRVILPDVETYSFVHDSAELATYRDTGIRAMQSTPLRARGGNLLGVLSTHWRVPHEPSEHDFRLFDIIARQASDLIEHRLAREAMAADLRGMQHLQELANLCTSPTVDRDACLRAALKVAIVITGADYGNIQLLDPTFQTLTIVAQHNFAEPFLDFFREVGETDASVCAETMRAGGRTIVEDVTKSEVFRGQPSLQILLDAGVRAVQSTALVSSAGTLLGMLSTHWREPHRPTQRVLHLLDLLARQLADFLERKAAEETRRLLIDELNHRAKNMLATVQAIAAQPAPSREPCCVHVRLRGTSARTCEGSHAHHASRLAGGQPQHAFRARTLSQRNE
jgi:GAF domain-containing protein